MSFLVFSYGLISSSFIFLSAYSVCTRSRYRQTENICSHSPLTRPRTVTLNLSLSVCFLCVFLQRLYKITVPPNGELLLALSFEPRDPGKVEVELPLELTGVSGCAELRR